MDKAKLLAELKNIEETEKAEKELQTKKENFKKFLDRPADYMIGKAHCDLKMINERYSSDRLKPLIPASVRVSGNCGHTYYGLAVITDATQTYFHNVWEYKDRDEFQEALNNLVRKHIEKICRKLQNVLEMMGLQSTDYSLRNDYTEADALKVKEEIKRAQKEMLDKYSDKEFIKLPKLSHGGGILKEYISSNRPHLLNKILNK